MPRSPFNTTAKFVGGPGTAEAGDTLATVPARLVMIDGVYQHGDNAPVTVAYLTVDEYEPRPGWTSAVFGIDPELADQVAVPGTAGVAYWVLYCERIEFEGRPEYFRAMLVSLPIPEGCDCSGGGGEPGATCGSAITADLDVEVALEVTGETWWILPDVTTGSYGFETLVWPDDSEVVVYHGPDCDTLTPFFLFEVPGCSNILVSSLDGNIYVKYTNATYPQTMSWKIHVGGCP